MFVIPPPLDTREVKARADFVAIASRHTRLRRSGRQYIGLCPFHKERRPSFYVEPERRIFYCFGCGAGGDVFDFVMRAEGCGFPQAVAILSEFLPVVERSGPGGCRRAAAPKVSGLARGIFLGVAAVSEPRSGSRLDGGVGAEPLGPRSGPAHIARKPEPSCPCNALRGAEPELPGGCEAERAALLFDKGKEWNARKVR